MFSLRTIQLFGVGVGVGLLLWLGVGMASVEAYILPARFYLQELAKQRGGFARLKIKQTSTYTRGTTTEVLEETLWIQCPGQIRLEKRKAVGGAWDLVEVDIWSGNTWQSWKKSTGQTQQNARTPQPRFDWFAVESSGDGYGSIGSLLGKTRVGFRGVQRRSPGSDYAEQLYVGLRWLAGRVAVVLGTRSTKSKRNQFWLDKKWRVPMRYIGRWQTSSPHYDIQFLEYHLHAGKPAFPGRVEVYEDGKLTIRSLVYSVERVRSFPAATFSKLR